MRSNFGYFYWYPSSILQSAAQKRYSVDSIVTFKVYGNCEMCKNRIEKAAKGKGIKSAIWDVDTKLLSLDYDPSITSPEKVQERIADAGHDTQLKKAKDLVYNELPDCCHYREKKKGDQEFTSDQSNIASHKGIVTGVVMEMDNKGNFHPHARRQCDLVRNGQRCNDRQ